MDLNLPKYTGFPHLWHFHIFVIEIETSFQIKFFPAIYNNYNCTETLINIRLLHKFIDPHHRTTLVSFCNYIFYYNYYTNLKR